MVEGVELVPGIGVSSSMLSKPEVSRIGIEAPSVGEEDDTVAFWRCLAAMLPPAIRLSPLGVPGRDVWLLSGSAQRTEWGVPVGDAASVGDVAPCVEIELVPPPRGLRPLFAPV